MSSEFIDIVAYVKIFFLFRSNDIALDAYATFIDSSVNGHLGYFHILTIINIAAMNVLYKCLLKILLLILLDI